ncbi:MAG: hypothetical protein J6J60_02635 [Clostridia bacterium]|nr:hypothetical protein [Clostridia bacterium]
MSLQEFFADVKNILLGKSNFENKEDFKEELQKALKKGIITKADATLLMQTMNNIKADATDLEKRQLATISLEDGTVVSAYEKEKKEKELERNKAEREAQQRAAIQNSKNLNIQKQVSKNKVANNANKLNIDRNKMAEAMKKDEKISEQKLNNAERDGKK